MKEKEIPFVNYIILVIILIISIIFVVYSFMWYNTFQENKLNTPIMDKYLTFINYNELNDYLVENKDAVIYVSVLEREDIRSFEKKFKNIIKNNSFNYNMLYLDITSEYKDRNLFNGFITNYNYKNIPFIITFRDGSVYDIYNIKDNDYNVDLLYNYFIEEGVISD